MAVLDISSVRGNARDNIKQETYSLFTLFVSDPGASYGAEVGQRLKLVEVTVLGKGASVYAQTIFEIQVEKDMCNVFRTLHGGCAAYIVDPCSVSSLVALGLQCGFDGTGLSQSMNLVWHQAVPCGTRIKVISTSMFTKGRVRTVRCEIRDTESDELYISAVHSTVNTGLKHRKLGNAKL